MKHYGSKLLLQYAQMKRRICVIDTEPSAALDVSQDAASPPVTDTQLRRVQIRGWGLRDQGRGPGAVHQGAGLWGRGQGEVR